MSVEKLKTEELPQREKTEVIYACRGELLGGAGFTQTRRASREWHDVT